MMKIKIDGKELKKILKGVNAVTLDVVTLEAISDTKSVIAFGMTPEESLEVYSNNVEILGNGKISFEKSDSKLLSNIKGEVSIIEEDYCIIVKTDVTQFRMTKRECEVSPFVLENLKDVAYIQEGYLYDGIVSLHPFTRLENDRKAPINCYNFNLKEGRMEATDTYRLGIKTLASQEIIDTSISSFLLSREAVKVFKIILQKYGNEKVCLQNSKNHTVFVGNNFKYTQKKYDGVFYNLNTVLSTLYDGKNFVMDCKSMLKITTNITKKNKPSHLYYDGEKLQVCTPMDTFCILERVKADKINLPKDYVVSYNSSFMNDAMKAVDLDYVKVEVNSTMGLKILGDEYTFLILPMYNKDVLKEIKKYLEV